MSNFIDSTNWFKQFNNKSTRMNEFEFHFSEKVQHGEKDPGGEHSSSSAIAFLRIPPVHPPSPTNVFLANFPKVWTESDLAQIFEGIPILTVHIIRDKVAPGVGISRGVGFVNVLYKHDALSLVHNLDRKLWLDVEAPLKIRLAKATAPQPRVDVDNIYGMVDPLSKIGAEFGARKRPSPRFRLLKELQEVISKESRHPFTFDSPKDYQNSPVLPALNFPDYGGYNMSPQIESWTSQNSFYSPRSEPSVLNSSPTSSNLNLIVTMNNVNQSKPPSPFDLWELNDREKNLQMLPSSFNRLEAKDKLELQQSPQFGDLPFSLESLPIISPKIPPYSSYTRGANLLYGIIGGPAVDLQSGTVISPRRQHMKHSESLFNGWDGKK
ncbi:hypothetical protein BY996DRAFT_6412240 [Phakopsora pachyrhizi]|uniref:RRM domain-containing protein n=1 Tax=Phakopsora pachyrhizi TaxID=170000 RepID=A0AAV0AKV8_PHAPC|nr:hypothetical protein BY996DRAFT_6412240 [Phakopsora pachyrhizi]CAH7667577.1 hypothetical protein PPACK8108_LOCUS1984 [Phakopsora pachyrhizi]